MAIKRVIRNGMLGISIIGFILGFVMLLVFGGSLSVDGEMNRDVLEISWYKARGIEPGEAGASACCDGEYIYVCGHSGVNSSDPYVGDLALFKWNAAGSLVWSRTWGGNNSDIGRSVWCDDTSQVYTCGYTASFGVGFYNMFLVKWDASGNQLWNRTWGAIGMTSYGFSLCGDDTGVYVSGTTSDGSTGLNTVLVLVKWDATGNQIWNRTWEDYDVSGDCSAWADNAGYIYTCGSTSRPGLGVSLLLIKWDAAGNQLWNRLWGSQGDVSISIGASVQGDGTGIYTCGKTDHLYSPSADLLLLKWDASGNIIWERKWTGWQGDTGLSVWCDGDRIYTCGFLTTFTDRDYDAMLIEWNSAGEALWYQLWGGLDSDYARAVCGDGVNVYVVVDNQSSDIAPVGMVLIKWGVDNLAIKRPVDFSYVFGSTNNQISWCLTDVTTVARTYFILRDDVVVASGTWACGKPVTIVVDELVIGSYNYTIIATDGINETIQDTVMVKVGIDIVPMASAIIIGSMVILGIGVSIEIYPKLILAVGQARANRESAAAKRRAMGRVEEVVYRKPKEDRDQQRPRSPAQSPTYVEIICPYCKQVVPKGAEKARFCIYCGKERLATI